MARQLILQNLMKLARGIGANPGKFVGTRTNVSFLGTGPTKNPLFQSPLAGIDEYSMKQLGPGMIPAVEDAMAYATAGKLNGIQLQILTENLKGINKVMNPPPLPMASVTPIRSGIEGLRKSPQRVQEIMDDMAMIEDPASVALKRFPKESHKFMGRPLKSKDFTEIDELVKRGKLPGPGLFKGPELPQKTYAARAALYKLLDMPATREGTGMTLREIMSKKDLKWLLEGGGGAQGDPIAMFAKYFGRSSAKQLPSDTTPAIIDQFAKQVIRRTDRMGRRIDDPFFNREDLDFAGGGLAHILQVPRSGYSKGRLVKGALAILNRNKKNAEYMFKASDNVSPGYAKGDLKYNAELLADQLAEDAGVIYDDLGSLERTKFYGTAYDYLAKEMGQALSQKRMMNKLLAEVDESMTRQALYQWKPGKGRKPSASGGLAGILEV